MTSAKKYTVPVVSGYFSSHSSLLALTVLHDAPTDIDQEARGTELRSYFNDLHQVFLHRFSQFSLVDTMPAAEEKQMAAMFAELLKIKQSLREGK